MTNGFGQFEVTHLILKKSKKVIFVAFQSKKLELANGVLTGAQSRGATKMTFDDLKKIFDLDSLTQKKPTPAAASSSGHH